MYSEHLVAKWRKLDNPEVMGWQVAAEAREIADFFESLNYIYDDTYATRDFTDNIAGLLRGCQFNENAYEDISVHTVNDLHDVVMTSYGVTIFEDFLLYHKCSRPWNWDEQFVFYYEEMSKQEPRRKRRKRKAV